jgi:hypothetical protein
MRHRVRVAFTLLFGEREKFPQDSRDHELRSGDPFKNYEELPFMGSWVNYAHFSPMSTLFAYLGWVTSGRPLSYARSTRTSTNAQRTPPAAEQE